MGTRSRRRVRLPGHRQDALPRPPLGIHPPRRRRDEFGYGQVAQLVVAQPDGKPRQARHGAVHGVLPELHAVQGVRGVGGHGADHVRRIDVPALRATHEQDA